MQRQRQLADGQMAFTSSTKKTPPQVYQELVFTDGNKHFKHLLADIASAKESIDLETYLFSNDSLGEKVCDALINAARRGVKVRTMVDGAGSQLWATNFAKPLEKSGAKTKVFHPFPWQMWNWSRSVIRLPLLLKLIYLILKVNSRNHRKVCIIDHEVAYVGSFNISICHLQAKDGGEDWRDTSVRLSGLSTNELTRAFDSAWNHRTIKERIRDIFHQLRKDPAIRLNHTWIRRRILYKNLLRKIARCKKRIWITNAYFVPDNFLLKKLKDAASRGVDVRVLLPKKSDVMMMPWASSTFYYSLLKAGIRIFEYLPSMLHAKSLILDDWVLIGSSNLNHRSILHDLEADINLRTLPAKHQLFHQFEVDLESSREISLNQWNKQRLWRQRFMGRFVLYIKYWI